MEDSDLQLNPALIEYTRVQLVSNGILTPDEPFTTKAFFVRLYVELPKIFNSAAKTFLAENKILGRAYNQTKHGFKVIKNPKVFAISETIADQQCLIMVKNPAYKSGDKSSGKILEFSQVDTRDFDKLASQIQIFTGAIKTICLLVSALLEVGIITTADNNA